MNRAVIFLVHCYRFLISPLFPPSCRFTPTCSQYAIDALTEYGLWRGSWLALQRLGRCHPWGGAGYDPIPHRHGVDVELR